MEEKEVALTILRGAAAGAGVTAKVSPDPVVSGVALGVQGILALVAKIVESQGAENAQKIFARLVENPATGLSDAELDKDVAKLRRELGL